MTRTILSILLLLSTASCVEPADADTTASALGGGDRPPPRPPREAVDACAGADAGDPCDFEHDGRHLTGACAAGPDADAPLACKPACSP